MARRESNAEKREYCRLLRLAFPAEQHERDYKISHSSTGRATRKRYLKTPKGRAATTRYQKSFKGRAAVARYCRTPLGRAGRLRIGVARRARKLGLTVKGWNFEIAAFYTRAQELRENFLYVSVDHIISLAEGGPHAPWNLQIILHHENCEKGDRFGFDFVPSVVFI